MDHQYPNHFVYSAYKSHLPNQNLVHEIHNTIFRRER
jgi:hypothetical protein